MPVPNSGEKYKPPVQRRDRMQVGDSRGKASILIQRFSEWKCKNMQYIILSGNFLFLLGKAQSPDSLLRWRKVLFVSVKVRRFFLCIVFPWTAFVLCHSPLTSQILLACAHLLLAACLSFACIISFFLLSLIVSDYRLLACFLIACCLWLSDCMMSVWERLWSTLT